MDPYYFPYSYFYYPYFSPYHLPVQIPSNEPQIVADLPNQPNQQPKVETTKKRKGRKKTALNEEEERERKVGHWQRDQNRKYHLFLQRYSNHFIRKQLRKIDKIFTTMSSFVGSRTAEQCRSHHQKMQKKYHSFLNILIELRLLHHSSLSIQPIKRQLEQNQIYEYDSLVTEEMLINNKKTTNSGQTKNERQNPTTKQSTQVKIQQTVIAEKQKSHPEQGF